MRANTVHIVQRMAPGGIETLVLDLLRSGDAGDKVYSLDGEREALVAAWPALGAVGPRLVAFGHAGGLSPRLLSRLVRQLAIDRPGSVVAIISAPISTAARRPAWPASRASSTSSMTAGISPTTATAS